MRTRLFLALALCLAAAAPAGAQLNIVLSPSQMTGAPGQTITYAGTITNNTVNNIYVDQVFFTLETPSGNTVANASPYASNYAGGTGGPFPAGDPRNDAFTFAPAQSYSGNLFDVTIASNETPGTYSGTFTLGGYIDSNTTFNNNVGTANFTLIVQSSPAPPSLVVAMVFGACGLVVLRRNRAPRPVRTAVTVKA